MSKSYFIIFSLVAFFANAQTIDISPLKFKDYYRSDIPSWSTCNLENAIETQDTLIFTTLFYGCCDYFSFKIQNKNISEIHTGQICIEPPTKTLSMIEKYGKIWRKKEDYFFNIYQGWDLLYSFKLVELSEMEVIDAGGYPRKYLSMTLVRSHKK